MALTSTFAATAMAGPALLTGQTRHVGALDHKAGTDITSLFAATATKAETLGIDHLLVAQRWWGSGTEIERSTYDAMAMTAFFAAVTDRIGLITAIHPGFFLPGPTAKWGATIDRLSGGRWAINVTTGWNLVEFPMYGADLIDHDVRYARSAEFIEILRGAWATAQTAHASFTYSGEHYSVDGLILEPSPTAEHLTVFQGGQSDAARTMAAAHSDWMFLNGGTPERIGALISDVRERAHQHGRTVQFAMYGIPMCRATDREAEAEIQAMVEAIDPDVAAARDRRTSGAQGMWSPSDDPLTRLDTNEGYASRLIGTPATITDRLVEFVDAGVDCFHLALHDERFNAEVLPAIASL